MPPPGQDALMWSATSKATVSSSAPSGMAGALVTAMTAQQWMRLRGGDNAAARAGRVDVVSDKQSNGILVRTIRHGRRVSDGDDRATVDEAARWRQCRRPGRTR